MRLCIFEDSRVLFLEPLTLTRPAFALWCGAQTLLDRQRRILKPTETGASIRPELAALTRLLNPGLIVNAPNWQAENDVVYTNARWLPAEGTEVDARQPHVGWSDDQVAYLVLPEPAALPGESELDGWLADWSARLPRREAGGRMLDYLWEAIDLNADMLLRDGAWFGTGAGARPLPAQVALQGPAESLIVADGALLEPFVSIDTRSGPVLVDQGAVVHSFSRIEGPCYIGKGTTILGAKVRRGTTLGPQCRIGGEVEASIVQGFSNKYHDGFLGHSYVGEWVNLAAGTHTSDLRNDYGEVKISVSGLRFNTGRHKLGSFIGDHTKTGLGVLLNTGSTIGAFAHVLPSGSLQPTTVPSFCQVNGGALHEMWDLRKLFGVAAMVMARRGQEWSDAHREIYDSLYEATVESRRQAVHESESRRLRHSI